MAEIVSRDQFIVTLVTVMTIVLAIATLLPTLSNRWFQNLERHASRFARKRSRMILCLGCASVLYRLAVLPIAPVPVPAIHDEFSYLLAADTFAHGRLTNPTHPMWLFLDTFHVLQHPTYQSIYPPAQGAVLALGQLLGHPWIGVICSMAAMVMAITWMLAGWFPPQWALLGGVLALLRFGAFSYWIDSYWGGAVTAVGGALVLGSFPRIVRHSRSKDVLLLALGTGLLSNSRPLEGFIFFVPVAVALGYWLFSKSTQWAIVSRRVVFPFIGASAVIIAFVAYYNWRVTHDFLLFPRALYQRERLNYPVFVWQHLKPPLHYANPQFEEFYNVYTPSAYAIHWSQMFWERSISWCYFFIGLPLYPTMMAIPRLLRDRRMQLPIIQFLFCSVGLLAVNYYFPHYAAAMTGTTYILLVQAMRHLRRWQFRGRQLGLPLTRLMVGLLVMSAVTLGAHAYRFPPEGWAIDRAEIISRLQATQGKHLVLVRYAPDHNVHHEWVYNGADIDGSTVVWAREIPGQDLSPLIAYFKDRTVWVVEADLTPPRFDRYNSPAIVARSNPEQERRMVVQKGASGTMHSPPLTLGQDLMVPIQGQ